MKTARDPTEIRFTTTKQTNLHFSCAREGQYINSADFYAYQDIRDYLEEMYVLAPNLIQESQSNWLNVLMNVTFLNFFCQGLELNQYDDLKLTLHSRVHGSGDKELDYLLDAYEKALAYLGIETSHTTQQGFRHLQIKGPRLQMLLHSEEGIHLFHPPNENALPIQVSLNAPAANQTLHIIRNYALPVEDGKKAGVLSDLRTGILNRSVLGSHEWALLWYAHLPEDERCSLF